MALPTTITGVQIATHMAHGRWGPFVSSGGNVYAVLIDSTNAYQLEVVKATDPTSSFSTSQTLSMTGNAVITSHAVHQESDALHIVTALAGGTLRYHVFSMSSDTFTTSNEAVTSAVVRNVAGTDEVDISVRSDGDVIIVYTGATDTPVMTARDRIDYARKESGTWTSNIAVDDGGDVHFRGVGMVRGASDKMHILYGEPASAVDSAWHKSLTSANSLSTAEACSDADIQNAAHSILRPAYYDASGTERIYTAWLDASASEVVVGALIENDGTPGAQVTISQNNLNALTNGYYGAQLVAVDALDTFYGLSLGDTLDDIFYDTNVNNGGWNASDTTLQSGTGVIAGFSANTFTRSGTRYLAYIYLDGTTVKYNELSLGSAGSTLTVTVAGSLTSAGALLTQTRRTRAGTLTTGGAIFTQSRRTRAGTLTTGGVILTQSRRTLAGSLTSAGAVATSRVKLVTRAGSLTSSGTLAKQSRRTVAGSLTSSGAILTQSRRTVSGSLTSAGAVLTRTSRSLAGTLTTAGALIRQPRRVLSGSLTSAGALSTRKAKLVTVAGSLTTAGALLTRTARTLTGTLTTAGATLTQTRRTLAGSLSSAGALLTQGRRILSGTLTTAATVTAERSQKAVTVAGTLAMAGATLTQTRRVLAGTLTTAGSIQRRTTHTFAGTLTSAGSLAKRTARRLAGALSSAGSLIVTRPGQAPTIRGRTATSGTTARTYTTAVAASVTSTAGTSSLTRTAGTSSRTATAAVASSVTSTEEP